MLRDIELLVFYHFQNSPYLNIDNGILEDLVSKKRHSEAARVLLDYSKDVREAVIALVEGNHFSEARRIVRHSRF